MSLNHNNIVITISGPVRSGKSVIAAVIKKALIDAGIPTADINFGSTGIYANQMSRKMNDGIMYETMRRLADQGMKPEEYPHPRKIHILEDTSDTSLVLNQDQLLRR